MEYRTVIKPEESPFRISHNDDLFLIGSCFASEIGDWLRRVKFNVMFNPFGVLYNPASVARAIKILISQSLFSYDDLFQFKGKYLSFNHDTSFSNTNASIALEGINNSIIEGSESLGNSSYLFITFGTSRIYRYKSSGQVVSNCHKIPATEFVREILSQDEIVEQWNEILTGLKEFNPGLKVIFTVSPVRHWKDGAHGNQLSKSILLVAIDKIIKHNPGTSYFPSYELLIDDLRDYRYYADDMLHPSSKAVEYIWNFFKSTYFESKTIKLSERILKITKAYDHITESVDKEELKLFRDNLLARIDDILSIANSIDFTEEREYFKNLV